MSGMRVFVMIGSKVPPREAPAAYNPRARPLRRQNHCDRIAMIGPENAPAAIYEMSLLILENNV